MILQLIINSTFMCDIQTSSFFSKIDAKNKPAAILIEKHCLSAGGPWKCLKNTYPAG